MPKILRMRSANTFGDQNYIEKSFVVILNFIVIFAAVSVFQGQNFSSDGYGIYTLGSENNVYTYLSSYRFFGALILKILGLLHHNFFDSCTVDTLFFAVTTCFAVSILTFSVCGSLHAAEEKKKLTIALVDISLLISVLNISSSNMMTFPECEILIGCGFLLCFFTASLFTGKNNIFTYAGSIVLIVAFTGIFQQFFAVFAVLLIAICSIKVIQDDRKGILQNLNHYIMPAGCCCFGGILYYILAKLLLVLFGLEGNPRAAFTIRSLLTKTFVYIRRQNHILKGIGSIHSYKIKMMLAACTVFFFVACLAVVLFTLIKKKQIFKSVILALALFASYGLSLLPGIIENTEGINVRSVLGFYSLFFMFTVLLIASGKADKIISLASFGFLSLVLSLFIFIMNGNELSQKAGNAVDNMWAKQIVYEINKYQNENDTHVDHVYICDDGDSQLCYMDVIWSRDHILKIFDQNNDYAVMEMTPEEKARIFRDKSWECFDADEQIVFEGDTAYICVY